MLKAMFKLNSSDLQNFKLLNLNRNQEYWPKRFCSLDKKFIDGESFHIIIKPRKSKKSAHESNQSQSELTIKNKSKKNGTKLSLKKDSIASYKSDPFGARPQYEYKKSTHYSPTSKEQISFMEGEGAQAVYQNSNLNQNKKIMRVHSNSLVSKSVKEATQTKINSGFFDP